MTTRDQHSAASEFLDIAFNQGEPEKAVSQYVGDHYVQHNPQVPDGTEAFIEFVRSMRKQFPGTHLETKRAVSEDGLVVTHSHLTLTPGEPGFAIADFFRFQDGKMVEHWDVIQNIPDSAANSNGMF
jgi:predicted SnoaL-like aldol condensation-catalyzing enzyme